MEKYAARGLIEFKKPSSVFKLKNSSLKEHNKRKAKLLSKEQVRQVKSNLSDTVSVAPS